MTALNTADSFHSFLSSEEKDIIASIELQALKPLEIIAQEISSTPPRIDGVIQQLLQRKVLRPHIFLNLLTLGVSEYVLYFRENTRGKNLHSKAINLLTTAQQVAWCAETQGAYQLACSLRVTHPYEALNFLNDLSFGMSNIFRGHISAYRIRETFHGRRYLSDKEITRTPLSAGPSTEIPKLSDKERLVIGTIIEEEIHTASALSEQLHMDPFSLRTLLRELEQKRVISGYCYILNFPPAEVVQFRVLISVRQLGARFREQFLALAEYTPEVVACSETLGDWHYEYLIELVDPNHIHSFIENVRNTFGKDLKRMCLLQIQYLMKHRGLEI